MQLIDPNHPSYRPLWARVLIVVVCFGWTAMEAVKGDPFWAVLAGGAGVYAAYVLLWSYKPPEPAAEKAAEAPDNEDGPKDPE